jgi:hypothetical protein
VSPPSSGAGPGRPNGGGDLPVIFISGKGRSGSTMLAMVLGEMDGITNGGELRFVWRRGIEENRRCGCGRPFADCPMWSDAMARVGLGDGVDVGQVVTAHDRLFRWSMVPRFILGRTAVRHADDVDVWASAAGRLYQSLAEATGASAIVDSSKWPADPAMLGLVPGIRPVVVQLVRDPRAVAWSWQRTREQYDQAEVREMDRFGPVHSSVSWVARNLVVGGVTRRWAVPHVLLRYEDVVADPAAAVRRIAALAGLTVDTARVIEGRTVQRSVNHTVAGNPARFGEGPLVLTSDDEWREHLPASQRRVVTAITAPLLHHYGYRLRSDQSSSMT